MPKRFVWIVVAVLVSFLSEAWAAEPKVEPLWPGGAPGALGREPKDVPTLTIWLPEREKAAGAAIVVCPGGGYGHLAVDHEGKQIAEWLNSFGVAAFVLEYRHRGRGYGHPAPLQDAQRAIRTVRAGAEAFGIDPKRIGILGFSAGGHLASTAATHFDAGDPNAADPVERVSCRPDFALLCYAVIAFGEPFTHAGSQRNLLGPDAPEDLIRSCSSEKQVSPETPPTFLWHTDEDRGVPSENSVQFYLACRRHGVPAELHVFRTGRHGLGLAADVPGTREWPKLFEQWMQAQGFLGGQ
ncbi:MAG: alpha/beta hydrolase [Thermoguttaceae bacterium]|jgi:acetyl esterase/lipase|nr:alpha/beta hydrolase [Thermoguttaceae bacterium]